MCPEFLSSGFTGSSVVPGSPDPIFSILSSPADGVHSCDFRCHHVLKTSTFHCPSVHIFYLRSLFGDLNLNSTSAKWTFWVSRHSPTLCFQTAVPTPGVIASFQFLTLETKESFSIACAVSFPTKKNMCWGDPVLLCPLPTLQSWPPPALSWATVAPVCSPCLTPDCLLSILLRARRGAKC